MSPKNQIEEEFTKKFMCAEKFARDVEEIVKNDNDLDYIGAIVFYCEKNNIELESVPKLISKPLKEKIRWNAMELNFLKKTSKAKLPV